MEWRLPSYDFFVDGRMCAWPTESGKSPYTIYLEIIQAREGWQKRLDESGTDHLLIGKNTFLALELEDKKDDDWEEIYEGSKAVLYSRR